MSWSKYKRINRGKEGEIFLTFSLYLTKFKSPNEVMGIDYFIHILPSLKFCYNDFSFTISFSWLTFNAWIERKDMKKKEALNLH